MAETVRQIKQGELMKLLLLYRHLHDDDADVSQNMRLTSLWQEIYENNNLYYLVIEADGLLVSSCTLAIIPNLTRNLRPYGIIENVVTHTNYRNRGLGTKCLEQAINIAREKNCYKVMLLTGSKREKILHFYENAGFKRDIKTGFIFNIN